MFRNYRQCYCMNNNNNNSCNMQNDMMETKCENVQSSFESYSNGCDCGFEEEAGNEVFPENPMLGQSYVPFQFMDKTYKPEVGLKMGTIFPELVSPYEPCQSMAEQQYIAATNQIGKGCNKCQ